MELDADSFNMISNFDFPLIATSCGSYPTIVKIRVALAGTFSTKAPLISVAVPRPDFPLILTLTPVSFLPKVSLTEPVT
ncbi:hypothetical protein D3C81_1759210 [compost metagenome]